MISAKKHLENYYGDKKRAVADLEKWLSLYENSTRRQTPKVLKELKLINNYWLKLKPLNNKI
jgi:hypothetical protein